MKLSSSVLLDALEASPIFKTGGAAPHVLLREVRNGTGFKRSERYADGVLVSLWPSRGVWLGGIEVKVARSDWLNELKNPAKSAEIQKWCKYWWLACAEGVAKEEEIPEAWGWVEVSGKGKVNVRKKAPALSPEPPTIDFLASILRNRAGCEDAVIGRAVSAALEKAKKETTEFQDISKLQWEAGQYLELKESVDKFCSAAEIPNGRLHIMPEQCGKEFSLAARILGGRFHSFTRPEKLRELADSIEEAEALAKRYRGEAEAVVDEVFVETRSAQ